MCDGTCSQWLEESAQSRQESAPVKANQGNRGDQVVSTAFLRASALQAGQLVETGLLVSVSLFASTKPLSATMQKARRRSTRHKMRSLHLRKVLICSTVGFCGANTLTKGNSKHKCDSTAQSWKELCTVPSGQDNLPPKCSLFYLWVLIHIHDLY